MKYLLVTLKCLSIVVTSAVQQILHFFSCPHTFINNLWKKVSQTFSIKIAQHLSSVDRLIVLKYKH